MSVSMSCADLKKLHKNADKATQKFLETKYPDVFIPPRPAFPKLMISTVYPPKLIFMTDEKTGTVVYRADNDTRALGKVLKKISMQRVKEFKLNL